MALNTDQIAVATIPFANIENGQDMDESIFDGNNLALLDAVNICIASLNNIKSTLNSIANGDSGADNIKSTEILGVSGTTVQAQLESIKLLIDNAVLGSIGDATLTTAKMSEEFKTNIAGQLKLNSALSKVYGVTAGSLLFDALNKAVDFSSYVAFCTDANDNAVDSAFGKNNIDSMVGLGKQLAMYAWFKGDSKVTYPFTNLVQCSNLTECLNLGYSEIQANANLKALFESTTWIKNEKLKADLYIANGNSYVSNTLTYEQLINANYATYFINETVCNLIANRTEYLQAIKNLGVAVVTAAESSATMTTAIGNSTLKVTSAIEVYMSGTYGSNGDRINYSTVTNPLIVSVGTMDATKTYFRTGISSALHQNPTKKFFNGQLTFSQTVGSSGSYANVSISYIPLA